jgi:hypothetical protein
MEIASAIKHERALDEPLEIKRWTELDGHIDRFLACWADGMRDSGRVAILAPGPSTCSTPPLTERTAPAVTSTHSSWRGWM